ncbi:hypothetical protein IAT38_002636 [Cryptococcus sp. DSM 104549]
MAYFINRPCHVAGCTNLAFEGETVCTTCPVVTSREHDPACSARYDIKSHECVALNMPDGSELMVASSKGNEDERSKESERKRFQYLLAWLDPSVIIDQAQSLRPGHSCTLYIPSSNEVVDAEQLMYTAMNLHLPIVFDDGVKWVVRVRQYSSAKKPAQISERVAQSEVTTLRLLKASGATVPMAWLPPPSVLKKTPGPSDFIVDYYFMEFVPGTIHWGDEGYSPVTINNEANLAFTHQFIDDLARHFVAIANHPLPSTLGGIGFIYPGAGKDDYTIGPLYEPGYASIPYPPYCPGPFKTQRERYLSHCNRALQYIYVAALNDGVGLMSQYLMVAETRKLVEVCEELAKEETELYVKHGDDYLRQYMSDETGHLTGVLDWEWAFVTTKAEAFCGPYNLPYPSSYHDSLSPTPTPSELLLMAAYERHGRSDLAECVRNGRLYHYLNLALKVGGYLQIEDINGLRKAVLGDKAGKPWGSIQEWKRGVAQQYCGDRMAVDLAWRLYVFSGTQTEDEAVVGVLRDELEKEHRKDEMEAFGKLTSEEQEKYRLRWVRPAYIDECFKKLGSDRQAG